MASLVQGLGRPTLWRSSGGGEWRRCGEAGSKKWAMAALDWRGGAGRVWGLQWVLRERCSRYSCSADSITRLSKLGPISSLCQGCFCGFSGGAVLVACSRHGHGGAALLCSARGLGFVGRRKSSGAIGGLPMEDPHRRLGVGQAMVLGSNSQERDGRVDFSQASKGSGGAREFEFVGRRKSNGAHPQRRRLGVGQAMAGWNSHEERDERGNFSQASERSGGASDSGIGSRSNWRGPLIVVGHTLALCCATAFVAWLLGAGKVYAASESGVLVALGEQASNAQGAMWHKFLQVLAVFKDQGVLLTALLGLSAFFSMAETSIMTLWPWKVRELAEKEAEGGVFRLLRQDVTRFLTTILIGTTVVNIAATALVTDASTTLFGEAGITAATGVMTVMILLLTEIAPKSIAVHNATEVARFAVRPVAWLSVILYPVGRIVTAMSMALLKVLGLKSSGEPFVSEEELKLMLRGAELSGAIEEEEQDMIENVLEIKDTFVREVMTPLVDVVAIDAESTLMEFRDYWVKHQYSRTPIFERRVDNIVGIAYAMDMLDYVNYDDQHQQADVFQRLTVGRIAHRPAYFVPDSMSVWNLLREFRIRKVHMAIVLNEYGGTVGVVTLEDVVEEIVGEIFDENDSKEEIRKKTGYVVQRADGVFDVDANTHIEDLSEALEVKMPEGPSRYETVSGFVCEAFGYIPRTGENINVILKKADGGDAQDRHDGEEHHQEDPKEKFQKFRVEILAGNARKVGAVRFELIKTQTREEEVIFPQNARVFTKGWAEPVEAGEDRGESMSDFEDEFCEPESMQGEAICEPEDSPAADSSENPCLTLEPVTVEIQREGVPPANAGYTVIGLEDWGARESTPDNTESNRELSFTRAKGPWNQRWVKQAKNVERRIQERRRRSADAAIEVERRHTIDLRRREVDGAMAAIRQEREDQGGSQSFQKRPN